MNPFKKLIALFRRKRKLIVRDSLEDAVKDASVVKIDVEGAEYSYNIIQPNLRAIILEFHPMSGFDWRSRANLMIEELQDHGFVPAIKLPTFKNGWDTNSAFIKK